MRLEAKGAVTHGMVRARARKLAVIHGRPPDRPSSADMDQAAAELTGDTEADQNGTALGSVLETMGCDPQWEEGGRSDCERLVAGGVEEAHSDQMLEAAQGEWDELAE